MTAMIETTPFFGDFYLRTTRPFLNAQETAAEANYLAKRLGRLGPVLDLGCGHGRHLAPLNAWRRDVIGVDLDALSLSEARLAAPVVRGDFFALPFATGAFHAAFAWYNTLFTFSEAQLRAALIEITRCIRVGGRLIVQNSNRAKYEQMPTGEFRSELADGSVLEESCLFDPVTGVDSIRRRLTLPDGRVMASSFRTRYYRLDELMALLHEAGWVGLWVHGGIDGQALTQASDSVIVGVEKRG